MEEFRALVIFITRFLYNGVAGYLPVFIVLGALILFADYENDLLTISLFVISVLVGNYYRLGERVYDLGLNKE